jgi:hypothetical protein
MKYEIKVLDLEERTVMRHIKQDDSQPSRLPVEIENRFNHSLANIRFKGHCEVRTLGPGEDEPATEPPDNSHLPDLAKWGTYRFRNPPPADFRVRAILLREPFFYQTQKGGYIFSKKDNYLTMEDSGKLLDLSPRLFRRIYVKVKEPTQKGEGQAGVSAAGPSLMQSLFRKGSSTK